jgi:ribosomal protein S13
VQAIFSRWVELHEVVEKAQVSQDKKVQDWNDDEIGAIRGGVCFQIEGELHRFL